LESLPLLPVLLNYKFPNERFYQPARNDGRIIVNDTNIDVVALLDEITEEFNLNYDQEKVLRTFTVMTISAPGLSSEDNENDTPVLLVHGVFGSGKRYVQQISDETICVMARTYVHMYVCIYGVSYFIF